MANSDLRPDENAPVRKFLFDRSFDGEIAAAGGRKPKNTIFTTEQVEAIKLESYESGFNAGQKAMADDLQKHANALLSQIERHVARLIDANQELQKEYLSHAQGLALAVVRKLLPATAERNGLAEIEALISQIVTEMAHEPRLVVRVGETQFDTISDRIKAITEQKAYAGKVVVLCEDGLGPSDCRIEWADGGIERDLAALWQIIDRLAGSGHVAKELRNAPQTENSPALEPVLENAPVPAPSMDAETQTQSNQSGETV